MDLDFQDCFGRKNPCLITKETWYPEKKTDSAKTQKDHLTEFDLQILVVSDNGSFIETLSMTLKMDSLQMFVFFKHAL